MAFAETLRKLGRIERTMKGGVSKPFLAKLARALGWEDRLETDAATPLPNAPLFFADRKYKRTFAAAGSRPRPQCGGGWHALRGMLGVRSPRHGGTARRRPGGLLPAPWRSAEAR